MAQGVSLWIRVFLQGLEAGRVIRAEKTYDAPHPATLINEYDLLGDPQYSDGRVLLETVYRFKGQAVPAIIFAELDFETLDDKTLRKLFVGMTRARLKLILVVSERAAKVLFNALGEDN